MKTLIINIDKESTLEKFLMLAKKLHIKTKLVDTRKEAEIDSEQEDWLKISTISLNNMYTEDEPDISNIVVKEPNPSYKI